MKNKIYVLKTEWVEGSENILTSKNKELLEKIIEKILSELKDLVKEIKMKYPSIREDERYVIAQLRELDRDDFYNLDYYFEAKFPHYKYLNLIDAEYIDFIDSRLGGLSIEEYDLIESEEEIFNE